MEQALTAQLENDLFYLSNKRVLLSNAGTKLDGLYYSNINSSVELAEATWNNGRLQIALSTPLFSAASQVLIPNNSFLGESYLHLELSDIPANVTLCRGWGYACIQSISYLFGSSNVSQQQINGHTLFQRAMLEADTSEKRAEMLRMAGEEQLVPTGGTIKADLLITFPWSSNCMYNKLPFDTSLLNNQITVSIQFNPASSIFGGSGAKPQGFVNAQMLFRQGDLTNTNQSLKMVMLKEPQLMYSYPFIHAQSITSQQFQGIIQPPNGVGVAANRVSLNLLSFINADLICITMGVIKVADENPVGGNSPNPFNYDNISNVSLKYNGKVMVEAPGNQIRLLQARSTPGAGYIENSFINPGAVAPFTSNPINTYIVTFDFSRNRAICFDREWQNVWRIGNNVLTLEFNTTTTDTYIIHSTYYYNGIAEVERGQTNIYYD